MIKRTIPACAALLAAFTFLTKAQAITINLGSDRDDSYLYQRKDRRYDHRRYDPPREARRRDAPHHRHPHSTAGEIAEMLKKGEKPNSHPKK